MTLKKYNEAYEEQSKSLIKYMLFGTIIALIAIIVGMITIDVNSVSKFRIFEDLNGINCVVGIISIPICLIYYYMYKNNEFFILTLSFVSILIEYFYINFILDTVGLSGILISFPFVFRILLLTVAIYKDGRLSKAILKNKHLAFFSVILLNIVGTHLELLLKANVSDKYSIFFSTFNFVIVVYYYSLLIRLAKRCRIKNEFIYSIFITSISIFTIRRIFYFNIFSDYHHKLIEYNKWISFVAYLILLIGLFIEIVRKIEESERLNIEIKDNKKIITTISEQYNEIKEVERIRNQFFANLSHEIKTPINIIYSCVQLLDIKKQQGSEELSEGYVKYDNTIKQNCYRMIRLVNNLVDMTKIDSGYMSLNFVNYEIVSLVEDITISIVPYVESKNINVVFDTYIEELEIKCDPDSIERVVLNLLSNSVKFTQSGGNILVVMEADCEWLIIRVKDDGVGIQPELKELIFERFVQADKTLHRKKEGSGIGLALVKSLVELHGGKIYLEDKNEKGSEFVIKLPNIKLKSNEILENNKKIDTSNKPMVEKIHIEFSDIYELF